MHNGRGEHVRWDGAVWERYKVCGKVRAGLPEWPEGWGVLCNPLVKPVSVDTLEMLREPLRIATKCQRAVWVLVSRCICQERGVHTYLAEDKRGAPLRDG